MEWQGVKLEIFVGRQFGDQGLCGSRQTPFVVAKTKKNDYKSGLKIRMFTKRLRLYRKLLLRAYS